MGNVFILKYKNSVSVLSAIFLLLSIITTFAIKLSEYEKKWYDGRAIAESVKTLSWRFMMNSEPFFPLSKEDAENRFLKDLQDIKNARKSFGEVLGGERATGQQLTDTMRKVRLYDLDIKRGTYEISRIEGQKKWYATNSKINKDNGEKFFWLLIILEIIAIILAVLITQFPDSIFNPTGVITTAAAGVIAWIQLKQYKNLAESYGLTAHELGIIDGKIVNIQTKKAFADFVSESETAISREHTLWLARRTSE